MATFTKKSSLIPRRKYSKISYEAKNESKTLTSFVEKPKKNIGERILELQTRNDPLTPEEMEEYYGLIEKQALRN